MAAAGGGLHGAEAGRLRVGVLDLQGDVREHAAALERAGAEVRRVKRPEELEGLAGLALPGGESTTLRSLLARDGWPEALRRAVEAGLGLFGTCAGAILMAREIEGEGPGPLPVLPITIRRNAFGRQIDSFVARIAPEELDPELAGSPPEPLEAVFIRAPRIAAVAPGGARVLARWRGEPVLVGRGRWLASTFHPELTRDLRVARTWLGLLASRG
ncbi:MAG: pyridoxal 5'-phosphate synthase glutaminase subunit PdxT [Bacillota bacterium]|nr:pyridoxal 5'-phosphate synthase glutaminase subunit PdxT [Bacillota bacterium]